jgi:hypothetical protein
MAAAFQSRACRPETLAEIAAALAISARIVQDPVVDMESPPRSAELS